MTFGPAWWLRPEERADVGTPPLVLVQSMFAAPILAEGLDGPPTSVALSVVLGGFFALLSLRNCLRLLRPRPVATTAMVVSLAACAILTALLVSGPILESAAPLRGVLVLPALAVLLVALAGESVRRVNLKQA